MDRSPVRPSRSPAAPRPPGRFPSPAQGWSFPRTRSPYAGSPRDRPPYSPGLPRFSPGSNTGFEGQTRNQGFGFRRQSFSPTRTPNRQSRPSNVPVEKYLSSSMLEDPWRSLQPVTAAVANARRVT